MSIAARNRLPGELYPAELRQLILSVARERQNLYESAYAADYSARLYDYERRLRRNPNLEEQPPPIDPDAMKDIYKVIVARARIDVLEMLSFELPPEFDDE
jgi:hypothetical protein